MQSIQDQVIHTWKMHNRIIIYVIENISDEALKLTLSKRGGRNIARQLAHINAVRIGELEDYAGKNSLVVKRFQKEEEPGRKSLIEAFEQSGLIMEKYLQHCINKEGKATNFKGGVIAMLAYYISHEAHHRGNIFLTMKQCGYKIPDELKWGIWNTMRK